MYAKDSKVTDNYIRILKDFDDHEKLRIISALTASILESQKEKKEESMDEFWSKFSAWENDGETAEETIEKIRNARCSGLTRHIESFDD
ncbi:MAG: hypothetical protein IJ165_15160 [Proteobacteria bacterium]|nr:hypothetical protein [Pseudomonadota bacterium]